MKKARSSPIKVALYGMDPRSYKTMELYLKGPCKGIAVVVNETEAEIDIIDADFATAGEILETRRQKTPDRPIVLLALHPLKVEKTYFLQKPVNAEQLVTILKSVKSDITGIKKAHIARETQVSASQAQTSKPTPAINVSPDSGNIPSVEQTEPKTTKKRAMFEDNEGGDAAFLGMLSGIDFSDPDQLLSARFDPRLYLLSYVLSAYKVACHENRALQLNSIWKPLMIFPDTHQIWLDADDKQLRAFAGVEQNKAFASNISLVPLDADTFRGSKASGKFQDIDVFIWKLTIWTSKGRFPISLEPDHPVYLKHWPNFTRLLLTPDALRISALLLQSARTPLEIIKLLDIKPQYVFALISACHSLGLLGKSERKIDEIIVPEPPKHSKKQSLLSKILHKLRAD